MRYQSIKYIISFAFVIVWHCWAHGQPYEAKNQKDFKAKAEKYFEEEDYDAAYKAYSQLVANFPKDPIFNYRLGVSMLFAEPDKTKAKKYLDFASQYKTEIPKEHLFYLGKYYHYNYEFDQAIKFYDNYKLLSKKSDIDRLKVENEIKACESGKNLLNRLSDLTVLDKKELPRSDFFLSYDFKNLGGRLIAKPAEFKSERDLKKKDNSVAFISTNTDKLFISNYNTDKTKGKDIYVVKKKGNGWGSPQNISAINTEMDEDFPFFHPNGKTLYFASKGHNTMGGYDIFKSEYDATNDTWGAPVNLDFPINTPLDDILFATDSAEKYAYFASNRSSEGNNFTIYKINTQRKAPELIMIQGASVKVKETESNKSAITVVNKVTGEVFGPITSTDGGKYVLQIANGGKFDFTVETPGFRSQTQEVQLKQYLDVRPVLQYITYNEGLLSIKTYLDTNSANNYARLLELIKQRASLSIDTGTNKTPESPLVDIQPDKVDATAVVKKPVEEIKPAVVSEQQIIQEAKADASKAKGEASSLLNAANFSKQALDEKIKAKSEAENELTQIREAQKTASKTDSIGFASASANKQNEVNAIDEQVKLLDGLNAELKTNADKKEKEAKLLDKYATDIALVSKAKDKKTALNNLDALQKELETAGNNIRLSKDIIEEYTEKVNQKANEGEVFKQQVSTLQNDIKDFTNEKEKLKEDQAATKDKDLKATYQSQIEDIEKDIADKTTKLSTLQQQAETASANAKNTEQLLAVLNGTTDAANKTEPVASIDTPKAIQKVDVTETKPKTATIQLSNEFLTAKEQMGFPADKTVNDLDLQALKAENTKVLNYNKAIDKEIILKKSAIVKAKTTEDKNRLQGLMDDLLVQKQSNSKLLTEIKDRELALAPKVDTQPAVSANVIAYSPAYELAKKEGEASAALVIKTLDEIALKNQSAKIQIWNKAVDIELQKQKTASVKYKLAEEKSKASDLMNDLKIQKQSNNLLLAENIALQKSITKTDTTAIAVTKPPLNPAEIKPTNESKVLGYTPKFDSLRSNYDTALVKDISSLDVIELAEQKKMVNAYNAAIDKEIVAKKSGLASTANADEKGQLIAMVNQLNAKKKENTLLVRKISEKQSAISIATTKQTAAKPPVATTKTAIAKPSAALVPALASNEVAGDSSKAGDYVQNQLKTKTVWNNAMPDVVKTYYKEVTDEPIYFSIFSEDLKRIDKLNEEIAVLENQKSKAAPAKQIALQNTIDKKKSTITVFKFDLAKNTRNLNRIALSRNKTKLKTQIENFTGSTEDREMGYGLIAYSDKRLAEANAFRDSANKVVDLDKKLFLISLAEQKEKQSLEGLESAIALTNPLPIVKQDTAAIVKVNPTTPDAIIQNDVSANKGFNTTASIKDAPDLKTIELSSLSPEKVAEVKSAMEYKSYANLKSDAKNLETSAKSIESKVNNIKGVASRNDNTIQSLKTKPGNEKKIADLVNANSKLNLQADSLTEIVFNTKAAAEAKHLEADLMLYSLDETKAAEIVAVSGFKPISQRSAQLASNTETVIIDSAKIKSDALMARLDSIRAATNTKPERIKSTETTKVKESITKQTETLLPFGDVVGSYTKNQVDFNGNGYSKNNPIPIDQPMPEGLIFKVQIGAFKTRPDDNAFGNITPIAGETTASGYTRYTAGFFDAFPSANGAKNDLSKKGFKDAYVVAYYNGKRISLDSARRIKGTEPVVVNVTPTNVATKVQVTKQPDYIVPVQQGIETRAIEVQAGLAYTVQIGAYSRIVTKKDLFNLDPIYTEKRSNTLYSFTTGLYTTLQEAIVRKNFAVSVGVKDAFVRAFKDGKRITLEEARQIEAGVLPKAAVPDQNTAPIEKVIESLPVNTRPTIESTPAKVGQPNTSESQSQPNVKAPKARIILYDDSTFTIVNFDNGISTYPIPDAENGVKLEDNGVCFRVQVGVFQGELPEENKNAFLKIKKWPIRGFRFSNGLTKYNVGNFNNPVSASALKQEVLAAGVADAFVIAYYDNKRISVAEAMKILENGGKRQ